MQEPSKLNISTSTYPTDSPPALGDLKPSESCTRTYLYTHNHSCISNECECAKPAALARLLAIIEIATWSFRAHFALKKNSLNTANWSSCQLFWVHLLSFSIHGGLGTLLLPGTIFSKRSCFPLLLLLLFFFRSFFSFLLCNLELTPSTTSPPHPDPQSPLLDNPSPSSLKHVVDSPEPARQPG